MLVSCLANLIQIGFLVDFPTMIIETVNDSETSPGFLLTTRRYVPAPAIPSCCTVSEVPLNFRYRVVTQVRRKLPGSVLCPS